MNSVIQFGVAIGMLGISGGMIFYDYMQSKAGRPLAQNEVIAIPYWMTYLMLLVLGSCVLVTAIIR